MVIRFFWLLVLSVFLCCCTSSEEPSLPKSEDPDAVYPWELDGSTTGTSDESSPFIREKRRKVTTRTGEDQSYQTNVDALNRVDEMIDPMRQDLQRRADE